MSRKTRQTLYVKVEAEGTSLKYTRTPVKQIYEDLDELCTTIPGQTKILSGKLSFPLQVRSTTNMAIEGVEGIIQEKFFRMLLKREQTEFAFSLVEKGIIPTDMDLIQNCCSFPSSATMKLLADILDSGCDLAPGVWLRTWDGCLKSLMNHPMFTDEMEINAIGLLERGADVQLSVCFGQNLSQPGYLTPKKMEFMLEHGLDINAVVPMFFPPQIKATGLNLLTQGIELNDFIQILTIIKRHLE